MKTNIREERLVVVSDVHLGNVLFRPRRPFLDLLHHTYERGYSLCINGDGVDISQMSLERLTSDLTPAFYLFSKFAEGGRKIHYVVGNHDIALEHFLHNWEGMSVVPFLNLHSGDRRIRIDHGHMYDDTFLNFPLTYAFITTLGRLMLAFGPKMYERTEFVAAGLRACGEMVATIKRGGKKDEQTLPGERTCFRRGATEVSLRGFDAVLFGHTHLAGSAILPGGIPYFNTGAWLDRPRCVVIEEGKLWYGEVSDFVAGRYKTQPLKAGELMSDETIDTPQDSAPARVAVAV